MDLQRNPFKAALAEGRQQTGYWCTIRDPLVAEMLAGCGFDWLLIDTEHAPMDAAAALPLLQAVAAAGGGAHPVVRVASLDPVELKKVLDLGAQSVLVPYVQTRAEAEAAVAAVTYPPEGIRGVAGMVRAAGFGRIEGYHRRAREEICLLVQIETAAGLEALEDIASVPGIDGIFIGPADLAASLGHPGEPSHPEVTAACLDAMRRIRAAGKPAGFLTLDQAVLAEMVEAGCVFTATGIDIMSLRDAAADLAGRWRRGPA